MDIEKTLTTTADVRGDLLIDLRALRSGNLSRSEARVRAYVAKQIIDTLKIEVVAANMQLDSFRPVPLLEAA